MTARSAAGCPEGWLCFYDGPRYTGELARFKGDDNDQIGEHPLAPHHRNRASSYVNNTNDCAELRDYTPHWNVTAVIYGGTAGQLDLPHDRGGIWDNRLDEVAMDDCL